MYRILPKKIFIAGIAWLVVGTMTLAPIVEDMIGFRLRSTSIPAVIWLLLCLILWNPIWRKIWQMLPSLNNWFPDLNGVWDVELRSNWPRQLQILNAASSASCSFDIRQAPEPDLAPMTPFQLRAEISQTWWSFEMRIFNPSANSPIKESNTISVEPIAKSGLRDPGICYFYKQENNTDSLSDDTEFYGAARLFYVSDKDRLEGLFWTARMWRRGMNTAGTIVFTRHKSDRCSN